MSEDKKVFLFGYSGHAYVVIESFLEAGFIISGYFDYKEANSNPYNIPYFGCEENVNVKSIVNDNLVFPSVGDNNIRAKLVTLFEKNQLRQCTLIDPSAKVSLSAAIDLSTYIGKNVSINALARIGKGVIINSSAVVEHECEIHDYSHIAPGAVLCGNVSVGRTTFIGANSVVRNNVKIEADVTLGAGSVVVKSIEKSGIWLGNPSKKIE